ncbi:mannitol dehydrogenase family protein [Leifsonia sp. NPDC058194]|uniref:mannitol dehydrogenase family protein n=1 Tax=Leifsonia sp. NPDC058194 TaxID=3346374 RepID=UPI0036D91A9A
MSGAAAGGGRAPVRIVHLGLGAFHRSHQAWYTAHAADAHDWGIAAYTGRHPDAADILQAQDCVYTLVERGAGSDRYERIDSIVRAVPGDDLADFVETMAAGDVAVVTLTVTEAGYRATPTGALDRDDPDVERDVSALRDFFSGDGPKLPAVRTVPGRLVLGLDVRRRLGAPPIAIVSCDNLPDNGALTRRVVGGFAQLVSPDLAAWLPTGASFVSTSVDRITPRLEAGDVERISAAVGWADAAPVVTEPFADWVLAGDFPSGRPAWESAGARFVDDIHPWEARKLWMLNGAHTLLASSGRLRGHDTVAAAFADPVCRAQVDTLWDEAAAQLPAVETTGYRAALAERFANPRIVHRLAQIAEGSLTKLRLRVVPVALAERDAGRPADGCATAIAAWAIVERPDADALDALQDVSPDLAADDAFATRLRTIHSSILTAEKADPTR